MRSWLGIAGLAGGVGWTLLAFFPPEEEVVRNRFRDCRMGESDFSGASLKDAVFERCDLREVTISSARLDRVELRGCDLAGLHGGEALRGARMPWNDVLENAVLLASIAGIEILTDE